MATEAGAAWALRVAPHPGLAATEQREGIAQEELHAALHVSDEKQWLECCTDSAELADLGDPDAPPDAADDVGMPVQGLAKVLAEGVKEKALYCC